MVADRRRIGEIGLLKQRIKALPVSLKTATETVHCLMMWDSLAGLVHDRAAGQVRDGAGHGADSV